MPISMTINIPRVFRRVGIRRQADTYSFSDARWQLTQVPAGETEVAIQFCWPMVANTDPKTGQPGSHQPSFLTIRASWQPSSGGKWQSFRTDLSGVEEAYARLYRRSELGPAAFATHHFAAAVMPPDARIRLEFEIDTDHSSFFHASRAKVPGQPGISVYIRTLVFSRQQGAEEEGMIQLDLTPAEAPVVYEGYLALDLGNTSSTLVCLPGGHLNTNQIHLVDADQDTGKIVDRPCSTDSAVRLNNALKEKLAAMRDHPSCFRWSIGSKAWGTPGGSTDGLVLGAKRRLAAPSADPEEEQGEALEPFLIWPTMEISDNAPRQPVPLPTRLPGELLLTRLLQRFREGTDCKPPLLAFTYPTTYSRRELKQLRKVLRRALARQEALPQKPEKLDELDQQLRLELDEASAGAFYFLFRWFFDEPGGLIPLRYHYPHGCNLLLYDCGGGTTDISLVRARVDPNQTDCLLVEVRGRSGVREFGGDNITATVFRLLKARLALAVATAKNAPGRPNRFPEDDPAETKNFLKAQGKFFNDHVPTWFDPTGMTSADRRSRVFTSILWKWALDMKHGLEKVNENQQVELFTKDYGLTDPLCKFLSESVSEGQRHALTTGLKQIRLQRRIVDGLIRDDVFRTVERCNHLIQARLKDKKDGSFPEEVDRLVLLGNASRYPLVQEMLHQHLDMEGVQEKERWEFDQDNLKTAVAKGAVLALAVVQAGGNVRIDFDEHLSDRLPFSIGYRYLPDGDARPLFLEHQRYQDLKEQTVQLAPAREGKPSRQVILDRCWPGEQYQPWVAFDFDSGIQGSVTVQYDLQNETFTARDQYGSPGRLIDLTLNKDVYHSPMQRGDL